MTTYPPINPNGKPLCWPKQHNEMIAGLCDACGQHARLYPIAEGPLCGPAAICANCIWVLTPRDPDQDQPLFAIVQRENEGRDRLKPVRPVHDFDTARFPASNAAISQIPAHVCEQQLAFDFTLSPTGQRRQAKKTVPQPANGAQPPAPSIAHADNVQSPPPPNRDVATIRVSKDNNGIVCDGCGQLIRIHLDNAVASRSGERCCLDCFEARYHLEPFIVTADWLAAHGAELDQDWRFIHDVAELMFHSTP